jgi:hypothetical protein
MATTIARPDRGYEGTYNYFDPDNYIATSALLWSGDRFLQEQVKGGVCCRVGANGRVFS